MNKTKESIIETIKNSPLNKVKVAICDIDGVLRGKVMHKDKFLNVLDSNFGFCDVVFGWDAVDVAYDNGKYTGWHTGYPDAVAIVDPATFRKVPWDNDIPFFLADFRNKDNEGLDVCPRTLLKKIIKKSEDMGYKPVFSQEFEWFNFKETPQSLDEKGFSGINPITPGMFGYSILRSTYGSAFFNDLFDLLEKFEVPLEGLHTETGPGVFEAAITYGDALESADRAVLFKTAVKEIAYKHGIIATFMAKWNKELPGCSGHVHQSLWDESKEHNLFYDEKAENNISELMQQYIAGQLFCLPDILPMIAPTINSFKRLVEGAWAPTTITWGVDNRTTALRALPGSKKATRLETRICGSDVNPYLAMAACMAAGLFGIENKLKLEIAPTRGNGYEETKNGVLPGSLKEATERMKNSDLSVKLFGEAFTDHFVRTREWEYRQFAQEVTDWELRRYFEII
ncbi:glutamine synthetase family protein [Chondrinema litorale]|uniref:glutamine synthetase family protein n=1 Tax=Chondrinema litorale TaxID=2994555 RepID=UPI002542D5B4|nr:glutamine synthetase family protein [Chondrinema litorale]UZR95765.1 glutamine synthetase family protein [Chondrinema litorale]